LVRVTETFQKHARKAASELHSLINRKPKPKLTTRYFFFGFVRVLLVTRRLGRLRLRQCLASSTNAKGWISARLRVEDKSSRGKSVHDAGTAVRRPEGN
jgi:hypothetical protein